MERTLMLTAVSCSAALAVDVAAIAPQVAAYPQPTVAGLRSPVVGRHGA